MKLQNIRLTLIELVIFLYMLPFLFTQKIVPISGRASVFLYAFLALAFMVIYISDTLNDLSSGFRVVIMALVFVLAYQYFWPEEIISQPLSFVCLLALALLGVILITNLHDGTAKVDNATNRLVRSMAPANCCSYEEAEPYISYEINRSRRYGNPLTFLYVTLIMSQESQDAIANEDRSVRELFRDQYDNQILRVFYNTIRTTDVMIEANGHYVIMMINTPRENAEILIKRLVLNFNRESGHKLCAGISEFPHDGIIYRDLIDAAKANLVNYSEQIDTLQAEADAA